MRIQRSCGLPTALEGMQKKVDYVESQLCQQIMSVIGIMKVEREGGT